MVGPLRWTSRRDHREDQQESRRARIRRRRVLERGREEANASEDLRDGLGERRAA